MVLATSAATLGPGVVDLLGGEEAAAQTNVALIKPGDPEFAVTHTRAKLTNRINAHIKMFNEEPKALFVNRYEFRDLHNTLNPLTRFTKSELADAGHYNVLLRGVPVMSVDDDVLYVEVDS